MVSVGIAAREKDQRSTPASVCTRRRASSARLPRRVPARSPAPRPGTSRGLRCVASPPSRPTPRATQQRPAQRSPRELYRLEPSLLPCSRHGSPGLQTSCLPCPFLRQEQGLRPWLRALLRPLLRHRAIACTWRADNFRAAVPYRAVRCTANTARWGMLGGARPCERNCCCEMRFRGLLGRVVSSNLLRGAGI